MATQENTTAGATCVVACKLPNGIEITLYDMVDGYEPSPSGPRPIKVARVRKGMKPIILNGYEHKQNKAPKNQIQEGFGLTFNVPKAEFEEWVKVNAESDFIVNGLIFAQDGRRANIDAQVQEHRAVKSGFERIDPKDKNQMRGIQAVQA
jgi:hypothetical protein